MFNIFSGIGSLLGAGSSFLSDLFGGVGDVSVPGGGWGDVYGAADWGGATNLLDGSYTSGLSEVGGLSNVGGDFANLAGQAISDASDLANVIGYGGGVGAPDVLSTVSQAPAAAAQPDWLGQLSSWLGENKDLVKFGLETIPKLAGTFMGGETPGYPQEVMDRMNVNTLPDLIAQPPGIQRPLPTQQTTPSDAELREFRTAIANAQERVPGASPDFMAAMLGMPRDELERMLELLRRGGY